MNFNVKFQTHNQDMNPSFAQMVEHVKKGKDGATFTPDVSPAGDLSWTNDKNLPNPETVNIKGGKGDPGASGVHIGTDTPPDTANVWVSPTGDPTSTEDWEFYMDDGSVDSKTVVVVGSDEETATGHLGILRVRQADGTWKEIPALVGPRGQQGDKGDAFTYADFTQEQLNALKGPQGEKGDAFTYADFTQEQLNALKGQPGDKGDAFTYADFTQEQLSALVGPQGEKGDKGDAFVYEDFTPEQLEALRGPQGEPGRDGYTPVKGVDYFDGVPGKDGSPGADGYTPVKGVDYFDGEKGDKGDAFTYADFTPEQLEALRGPKGDPGRDGSDASVTSANITAALGYTPANEAHEHSAENITSGILPLSRGGTGAALSTKVNAIIRFSSNSAKMSSTATANGAFYATADNGSPKFGTLPIAQGGTGATDAATARANIGAAAAEHEHEQYLTEHQSLADYAKKSEVPSNTENWTFTLEDGSTVTKAVYVG